MKSTANFKLPKSVKRQMATFVDAHQRGAYKRQMIDALLCAQVQPRSSNVKSD